MFFLNHIFNLVSESVFPRLFYSISFQLEVEKKSNKNLEFATICVLSTGQLHFQVQQNENQV